MFIDLIVCAPHVPVDNLKSLLSFGLAVQAADSSSNLPDFPLDNLHLAATMMVIAFLLNVTQVNVKLYISNTFYRTQIQS